MSRARELDERLGVAEELTIVCHNNPDPDCLASAFALDGWRRPSESTTDAFSTAARSPTSRTGRSSICWEST